MDENLTLELDTQLNQIENLTWYPWIGKDYLHSPNRLLVIGDSHYATEESFKKNKNATREVVTACLDGAKWRFFQGLIQTFQYQEQKKDIDFWEKLAFYNFIQRPMKEIDEKPCEDDYLTAWPCFIELIKLLKPTACIFIGVRSERCFGHCMEQLGLKWEIKNDSKKINNTFPRIGSVRISKDYTLNLTFIKHSSKYFSPDSWYKYLKKQIPETMKFINS